MFIRVVHEIFHAMYEGKESSFGWSFNINNHSHGEVLNIIACLESDVYDTTNAVIEGTPMRVFKLF